MAKKWSLLTALLAVLTLSFVIACSDDEEETKSTSGSAAPAATAATAATAAPAAKEEEPAGPTGDLLVRDVFFTSNGFTPPLGGSFFEHRWTYAMYEGLTALDTPAITRGDFPPAKPSLATSWEISPDGKVYTFQIRSGVKFTTGRPLTALAVKKSLEHTLFALDYDGSTSRFGWAGIMETIEATGDMEVTITLSEPYMPLIAAMAGKQLFIVDAEELISHQVKDDEGKDDGGIDWGRTHSAGTGPFKIDSWVPEQRLTLVANTDYWGGHDGVQPGVKTITVSHIPENATAELQVGNGEVHVGMQLDPVSIDGFESNTEVDVFSYGSLITCNFLMDRRTPPLEDDRVFKAIRYAVDYEGVKNVVALGLGNVHQSLILPGMQGHDPAIATRYSHDPEKAKALLTEAGYPDGFDIEIHLRTGSCGAVPYQKALEFFQNNLKQVGINATIVQSTSAKFWGAIIEESFRGMGISGLGATYLDGDNVASVRATGECFMLGLDDVDPAAGERLAEIEKLGRSETDETKRNALYREMSDIMVDKCGLMTILQVRDFVAHASGVSGLTAAPHAFTIDYRYIRLAE